MHKRLFFLNFRFISALLCIISKRVHVPYRWSSAAHSRCVDGGKVWLCSGGLRHSSLSPNVLMPLFPSAQTAAPICYTAGTLQATRSLWQVILNSPSQQVSVSTNPANRSFGLKNLPQKKHQARVSLRVPNWIPPTESVG